MLNTHSRLSALTIWAAIALICLLALWSFLSLPPPGTVAASFVQSEAASAIVRNQVLFSGLAGFGGLALAYLYNGWRDRAARRQFGERREKRLANVLAREASGLAVALEAEARIDNGARLRSADLADASDSLLLSLPIGELARLGAGATTAVLGARRSLRRLTVAGDEVPGNSQVKRLAEAILAARDAARVLQTLGARGSEAADRLRLLPHSEADIAALTQGLGDGQGPARLAPAA